MALRIEMEAMMIDMMQLYMTAHRAGLKALEAATPTPMNVVAVNPITGSPIVGAEVYHVEGGVCGFAWIHIPIKRKTAKREATPKVNQEFVNFCKNHNVGHKGAYGGFDVWVREGGQSMQRKEAYANAFAQVLKTVGIDCYPASRMD